MTVSSSINRSDFAGNGSTTAFATGFRFLQNSDIKVILTVTSTGVETVQVEVTNYTLVGAGLDAGGTVTMLVAPATGETLTIKRDVPLTQGTDYVENDTFPAESHEDALDKLTMIVQQQQEELDRSIKLSESSQSTDVTVPDPESGLLLEWDSAGNLKNVNASSKGLLITSEIAREFPTLSDAQASNALIVNDVIDLEDRTTGNGGGGKWNVINKGTTPDVDLPNGFDIVASTANSSLAFKLRIGMILDAAQFGVAQGDSDDSAAVLRVWSVASSGTTIMYPGGNRQIPAKDLFHPDKQLYHIGVGRSAGRSPDDTSGTVFRNIGAANSYLINMLPPLITDPANSSRFSSFSDMSCFGNGTLLGSDDDATNNFIKINNQGTNFENVSVRWIKVGLEVNTAVGQHWEGMIITCSSISVLFKYDPTTPFNAIEASFATANTYKDISINTSKINANAVGWLIDATCAYSQNTLINVDLESCKTAMVIEGRIASKDAVSGSGPAFGAAAFGSGGNNHIGCWFEANDTDVVINYDLGQQEPAIIWNSLNRTAFTITGQKSNSWVIGFNTIQAIMPDALENGEGSIGDFNNPLTAGQFVFSGPKLNTVALKSLVNTRVPHQAANRPTVTTNSSFEFDVFKPNMPLAGAPLNVANIIFGNSTQSATVEITQIGTNAGGTHFVSFSKHLVGNTSDAIADTVVTEDHDGATQPFFLQSIRVAVNTFGLFIWKDASLSTATHMTMNVKVTLGGSNTGGNGGSLTVLL